MVFRLKEKNSHEPPTLLIKEAVSYARVSSKEQEKEGFSIPSQDRLVTGYAANNRLIIVQRFEDVETAKRPGRPDFDKMVAFLKKNPRVRVLLVEKTDRLYRNLKDYVTMDEFDIEIHFIKENFVLSKDSRSSEKFMHGIKVLMAKNYIDNLSEETKKGLLEKAEEMIYPSYAPLGYRNVVGPNGKKIIEPDPDRAAIIILIFEWYDTGNYSIDQITEKAAKSGLVSRHGNRVSKSNTHYILRKRIYTGDFDWNGKTYRGNHKPLISCELFERVQAKLDGRFEGREKKANREFAFSGLIKCGHCGCALVGELKKGRYVYYHCTGRRGKCGEPYTREEILEEQFGGYLKRLVFDDEVLDWLTDALKQSHEDEKRFRDSAVARLREQYDTYKNRLDKLYEDKVDGVVGVEFFKRKSGEWDAEQTRILRAIDEHHAANHSYIREGVKLLELAKKAYSLYEKQKADEKRKLLNFVCSNSTWREGRLTVNFRQPFDVIAVTNATWINEKVAGADSGDLHSIWLRR